MTAKANAAIKSFESLFKVYSQNAMKEFHIGCAPYKTDGLTPDEVQGLVDTGTKMLATLSRPDRDDFIQELTLLVNENPSRRPFPIWKDVTSYSYSPYSSEPGNAFDVLEKIVKAKVELDLGDK